MPLRRNRLAKYFRELWFVFRHYANSELLGLDKAEKYPDIRSVWKSSGGSRLDTSIGDETMKTAIKTMMVGVAACAFAAPTFAYTLTGTIPGNTRNMTAIHLQKPPGNGYLKLTLSAPPANVGVGYSVGFCVSLASLPASNPCALNTQSGFLVVPGQPTTVFINTNAYPSYVVWVGTGLRAAVPYTLDVEFIP